jgi:hypothetical protein
MTNKLWIIHKPTGQRFCLFEQEFYGEDIKVAQRPNNLLAFLENINQHETNIDLGDFTLITDPMKAGYAK